MILLYKAAVKNDVTRAAPSLSRGLSDCVLQKLFAPSISQGFFPIQNAFRWWRARSRAPGVLIQLCIKSTIYVVYLAGLIWIHPLGSFQPSHVLLQAVHFLIYE